MKDSWVRTIRTAVQTAIAAAAAIPAVVPALGLSTSVGLGASLVACAAAVTRVMAIPVVSDWVNKLLNAEEK